MDDADTNQDSESEEEGDTFDIPDSLTMRSSWSSCLSMSDVLFIIYKILRKMGSRKQGLYQESLEKPHD